MKEFINLFESDIQKEQFTRRQVVMMTVVYPAALIAMCAIASLLA